MRLFVLLLSAACVAHAQIDPRGARPVVPNTRSEKCAPEKEWPFCTDDQWGPKCPSGCRINGLLEKFDHEFLKRIERIRGLLGQSQDKQSNADKVSKQTYNYLREKLTVDSGLDNNYFDMAQTLRQRITDMKIKIDQQLHVLGALKERVRDQVNDMQRLEVDIDMKLRTCKGSCKTYHNYEVDHEEQVALEKQMNQLDSLSGQSVETWGSLQVMKSRPLSDAVVDSVFKSKNLQTDPQTAQQQTTEDLFPEVKTVQLFLEVEGSSSSPATISKVPVCLRLIQNGRQSFRGSNRNQRNCVENKLLPLCSDHDQESRCPSGCRLQGLIEEHEKTVDNKLRKICQTSANLEKTAEKTMRTTAEIYHRSREELRRGKSSQMEFVDQAAVLSKNLTLLQERSDNLETQMKDLKGKVREQLDHLLKAEVEVGMILRSCGGSCRSAEVFSVAVEDFSALHARIEHSDTLPPQVKQTKALHAQTALRRPQPVPSLRLAPLDLRPEPNPVYKTIRVVLEEELNLFEDLDLHKLKLEERDSTE